MLTINFNLLKVNDGERVLDAGCGTGRHTFHLCKERCFVIAMDLLEEDVLRVKYFISLMDGKKEKSAQSAALIADVHHLPFKDGSFHKIVCSEVLEHLPDDQGGLSELVRALKKGGEMAISVPTFFSEALFGSLSAEYFNTPGGHIRKYKAKELAGMLKAQPLSILALRHEHSFHTAYWMLRCIFGLHRESALIPRLYKMFLDWTIASHSFKSFDRFFNRMFPKSIVFYARKTR